MGRFDMMVFEVAFSGLSTPVVEIWEMLSRFLSRNGFLPESFLMSQIAGHDEFHQSTQRLELDSKGVGNLILDRCLTGFRVDSRKGLSYGLRQWEAAGGGARLHCGMDFDSRGPNNWQGLIEGFMLNCSVIGGWQWRSAYFICQRATRLHESYSDYYGGIPSGVTRFVKKDAAGIRGDREFIDTSKFPGRSKQILPMVSFHPSAEMWLGPDFWQYAKCTKEEVLAADFFLEKRDTPHFLYLKSWPESFTRPDGEQGRQQQRLWKLFFHEDCEWPPGSGGICDGPMYGPPELMPGYKEKQE